MKGRWALGAVDGVVSLLCAGLIGFVMAFAGGQATGPLPPETDLPIYQGRLAEGWQNWSWAKHKLRYNALAFMGRPVIRMEADGFRGVYLHHEGLDTTGFRALSLWVRGEGLGGQRINVCVVDTQKKFGPMVALGRFVAGGEIKAERWSMAVIPLTLLKADNKTITGMVLQDAVGKPQGALYFAEIKLIGRSAKPTQPYTVDIDTSRDVREISPLIYGMAHAKEEMIRDLRLALNRWGGNPNTRYNWEGNFWNRARDWKFMNSGDKKAEYPTPGSAAERFIAANQRAGAETLFTIPTIGWVARDGESRSLNVPDRGGVPLSPGGDAIAGYDPAENRRRTSVRSYPRKRGPFQYPPDLTDEAVYQDEFVAWLTQRFGKAQDGGVRFYAMDNEPDLWAITHTDVHPVAPGYDDLLSRFLEYATAVKDVDPSAQVTGPVSWGWTGYFHSPRDAIRSDWNGRPDRRAHNDLPFLPWFLSQVREHDRRTGRRTLDVLDIHFYPQGKGVYPGWSDPRTEALRLRSTRALWDPDYADESWIGEPVRLIPRLKDWIERYYPGTKLGLTEWNFGADKTLNGGMAIAECLGIFGREGVYLANYWTTPPPGSPGYFAFKMYRNADGEGNGFGDRSVRAVSSAPDDISCFASVDSRTGQPVAILLNKQPARDSLVTVRIKHSKPLVRAALYRYGGEERTAIVKLPEAAVSRNTLKLTLPGYSMTLVRFL